MEFMAIGVVCAWHGTFHGILFPKKYGLIPKNVRELPGMHGRGDTSLFHAKTNAWTKGVVIPVCLLIINP